MNAVNASELFAQAQAHHRAGRLANAEKLYRQILATQPHHPGAQHYLGVIAHQVGRYDLAITSIRRALELQPSDPAAHSNLGEAYRMAGRLDEAIACFHRALQLAPSFPDAWFNLGNAFNNRGQSSEALAAYQNALACKPAYPEALNNLGNLLKQQGDKDGAIRHFRRALELRPEYAPAWNNMGSVLVTQGRFSEAVPALRRAIAAQPDSPEAYNNLATALAELGELDESAIVVQQALRLRPDYAVAWCNLGNTERARGRHDAAAAASRRALQIAPETQEALNNLGLALAEVGRLEDAMASYRRALDLNPGYVRARSNLIYTLHFHAPEDVALLATEEKLWNQQFSLPFRDKIAPHTNSPQPERRLKIGYVSADFRTHAVAIFLTPLLEAHDHAAYEIHCYANVRRPDAVTARLQKAADHWRDIHRFTDEQLAQCIREDGIDILVDLGMHTAGNRLPVFARRPAPVQVTWLAYPGRTGVETIDYRLTDRYLDPPGETDSAASERPVPLPDSWCCYAPIEVFPNVTPSPAAQGGAVTFGSLNQFRKIHEGLLDCWARLLQAAPATRLLMVCPEGSATERVRAFFAGRRIALERIELVTPCPWADYLRLFERIDIALDSFPCNGMTTTCHALWMGVPVVTLSGKAAISRAGESLLRTVGLAEWIARDEDEYLRLAIAGASDPARLAELRRTMRSRMQASPLMDAPRFARNVEAAYHTMWQKWCAQRPC